MSNEVSSFVLVEWEDENKFSVIPRSKIVEEEWRIKTDDELINTVILCYWGKEQKYPAKVIQCGDKINLDYEVSVLTASATPAEGLTPLETRTEQAENIVQIVATAGQQEVDDEGINYKFLYEKEVERSSKYKNKVKTLRTQVKELKNQAGDNEEVVKLSSLVSVKKSQIDMIKTISGTPTVFAGNLLRIVFSDEDIFEKSLFGRKCNANNKPPKPSIDQKRRDSIIMHTLEVFCDGKSNKGVLHEVHRSMGDYIREVSLPWRWLAVESLTFTEFSIASDVWAFGVTLWEMFSLGALPYPGQQYNNEFVQMLRAGFRLPLPEFATYSIYNIILDCWRHEPLDRPTFEDLKPHLDSLLMVRYMSVCSIFTEKPVYTALNEVVDSPEALSGYLNAV